jgi:hypothetical protein
VGNFGAELPHIPRGHKVNRPLPVAERMFRSSRPCQGFAPPLRALDMGSELRAGKPTGDGQRDASGGGSELGMAFLVRRIFNQNLPTTHAGGPVISHVMESGNDLKSAAGHMNSGVPRHDRPLGE